MTFMDVFILLVVYTSVIVLVTVCAVRNYDKKHTLPLPDKVRERINKDFGVEEEQAQSTPPPLPIQRLTSMPDWMKRFTRTTSGCIEKRFNNEEVIKQCFDILAGKTKWNIIDAVPGDGSEYGDSQYPTLWYATAGVSKGHADSYMLRIFYNERDGSVLLYKGDTWTYGKSRVNVEVCEGMFSPELVARCKEEYDKFQKQSWQKHLG